MTNFRQQLLPKEYVPSVYDIHLDKLWNQGKRLILTDLDNTLVPWNERQVSNSLTDWFSRIRNYGFNTCLVTNNRGQHVTEFARQVGARAVRGARKPRPHGFLQAMSYFNASPAETVMIGDQLFTDIRGGNRLGLYTILVVPIHKREWWGTRMNRVLERAAVRVFFGDKLVPQDTDADAPASQSRLAGGDKSL